MSNRILTRSGQPFPDRIHVYVAGPYTRPDPVANTHQIVKFADRLQALGYHPVVPHVSLLWHLICPHEDVEFWYEHDLYDLARCDVVIRVPGPSSGADKEVQFAIDNGIPVVYTVEALLVQFPVAAPPAPAA